MDAPDFQYTEAGELTIYYPDGTVERRPPLTQEEFLRLVYPDGDQLELFDG